MEPLVNLRLDWQCPTCGVGGWMRLPLPAETMQQQLLPLIVAHHERLAPACAEHVLLMCTAERE